MAMNNAKKREKAPESGRKEPDDTAGLTKTIKRAERSVVDYQHFGLRLVIFLAIVWLLFFVFIGVTHMPSEDMYPRIDPGDFILFYRLDKDVKAQDIIVFEKEVPTLEGKHIFICRVVAVAGDTVDISEDNRLIINGNTVLEPNIFYLTPRCGDYVEYPITLGQGECFALADSRNSGTDSRYFGPVTKDEIDGTVITIVRRNNL